MRLPGNNLCLPLLALSVVLTAALYWPGLQGGFFFDDEVNILLVEQLRLDELSWSALWQATGGGIAGPLGRPISQLSFALNYYFSGFAPFAFKLTNLVIHCLNGILVFLIARRLLVDTKQQGTAARESLLPLLVATIWLVHPIQLTSVLYVVQRMTSLSALFLLLALLLHLQARSTESRSTVRIVIAFLAWFVLWPLSVLSKESGVLFVGYVSAYELLIRRAAANGLDAFGRAVLVATVAGAAAIVIYLLTPAGEWLMAGYANRDFSLAERLFTEARVLWRYLGLIVVPRLEAFALYHDYIAVSRSLLSPATTLPSILGIVTLVLAFLWARVRYPLLAFGIAWFLVGHSLESTVLPLELAHEHRNYIALFGVVLVPTAIFRSLYAKYPQPLAWNALVLGILLFCVLVTAMRSHQYGDEIRRTQIEAQHHPDSSQANYQAGLAIVRLIKIEDSSSPTYFFARRHYEFATELDENSKYGLLGLIHLNCLVGQDVESRWVELMITRIARTPFAHGDRSLFHGIKEMAIAGNLCLEDSQLHRIFDAKLADSSAPGNLRAALHSWLADYLVLRMHDFKGARIELGRALELVPNHPGNLLKLTQVFILEGNDKEALRELQKLNRLSLFGPDRRMFDDLAGCLRDDGKRCSLIEAADKALLESK
jgi:hypothetical protein